MLDPNDPNIVVRMLSQQELIAELQRRQALSDSNINDLDADQIDKLVIDTLTYRIATEPRLVQAQLDFSDIQFQKVTAILNSLRSHKLEYQNNQIDAMCYQWSSAVLSNVADEVRIANSLAAYEEKEALQSTQLFAMYQSSLNDIRDLLGPANGDILDQYISIKQEQAKKTAVYEYSATVGMFGDPKESIESNCKGRI